MAAWTVAVALAVALHGLDTPVHTDDAYRIRAFAPILAAAGAWNGAARDVIAIAGPVPTYVPSLAWMLGAGVDPVHVSASIVLTFLALLALLVTLGAERGVPEAGWGAAFAITSMPFFAYHAASTYSDAWLGMFLAAAFAFLVAYGRTGAPADAGRAMLLLVGAALVKREGELLVASRGRRSCSRRSRGAGGRRGERCAASGCSPPPTCSRSPPGWRRWAWPMRLPVPARRGRALDHGGVARGRRPRAPGTRGGRPGRRRDPAEGHLHRR